MVYRVFLSTKIKTIKAGTGIIVIEPDDYTDAEIKAIKEKGYKLLAYLSAGTIETERPWWKSYSKCKLKRLTDWPKEYFADVRKAEWRDFIVSRAKALKNRGFDGWWIDNIDVYSEYKSKAMFTAVADVLQGVKKLDGYVMVNGGSEWLDDALDKKFDIKKYISGYTQEEAFSLIKDYSGKGKFGKQNSDDKRYYQEMLKRVKKASVQTFLLEYTRDEELKNNIIEFCRKHGMSGYYISSDVDL